MPSPSVQAVGTSISSTGDVAVDWPAHQAGDLGILIFEGNNAAIQRTISGWTDVTGLPEVSDSSTLQMKWKIASSASEPFVTIYDIGDHVTAVIMTIRGVNPTNPFEAVGVGHRLVSSTTVTLPEVTTNQDGSLIVAVATRGNDSLAGEFSGWNYPQIFDTITEEFDYGTASGDGGGIGIASVVWTGHGDTGDGSATTSSSSYQCGVTMAFAPYDPPGCRVQFIGV